MTTDPHLAAYAKGLEDAARWCAQHAMVPGLRRGQAPFAGYLAGSPLGENHPGLGYAAAIRALSPLPPGSRVVVVPPEGSEEFDCMIFGISKDASTEQWSIGRWTVERVLRALTGGDDRG